MNDPMIARHYDLYLRGEYDWTFPSLDAAIAHARKWGDTPAHVIEREYDGYFDFAQARTVWERA